MLTARQHEKLIDRIETLSELELDQLLKDIGAHLRKNNLEHLIDGAFQMTDYEQEISDLEQDLENMENERDEARDSLNDISKLCMSAEDVEEFDEEGFEKLKKIIEKISDKT